MDLYRLFLVKKHCNFAENIFVQIFFHLTLYIEREIILWCELDVVFHVPGDRKLREQKMLLTLQTTWNVEQKASQHCRNRKKKLLFQEEGSFFLSAVCDLSYSQQNSSSHRTAQSVSKSKLLSHSISSISSAE